MAGRSAARQHEVFRSRRIFWVLSDKLDGFAVDPYFW